LRGPSGIAELLVMCGDIIALITYPIFCDKQFKVFRALTLANLPISQGMLVTLTAVYALPHYSVITWFLPRGMFPMTLGDP